MVGRRRRRAPPRRDGAVALDDGWVTHGCFVDHGHAADEAIFDLDVNRDEILEDDAARRVGAGYVHLDAP